MSGNPIRAVLGCERVGRRCQRVIALYWRCRLYWGPDLLIRCCRVRVDPELITLEKLAVYRKYAGDIDGWSRMRTPQDDIITGAEWSTITHLLQELTVYKRNLVSERYGQQIQGKLMELAADDEVARQLLDIA